MTEKRKGENQFGKLLKDLLKECSLSMRKLSQLTGIDTATISRIANQKQQPKPTHLQQFAFHLQVPLSTLMNAAGYSQDQLEDRQSDLFRSLESIQDILVSSDLLEHQFTIEKIHQELAKYEHYALTSEGKSTILKEFEQKVEQVKGAGPFIDELKVMYKNYCADTQSIERRRILGSVLLYFILSTDIIPDYVFPFGYVDDCLAVQIGLERLSKLEGNNV
ncbi:DUF1232 domain-containing protein [Bacillus sp. FJAT-49736]|uniref:DUF1232 domain-containing protein n=1 Tax=Bacillus sp. FJAT-49736 TaxID=2833582 RepID=UPI001BCA0851|nr:DUF1232 domain-containing protein [Bacillus sp. FJAT-49736]MBS4173982.1 DUF1232 domain-containing protein [Bacillus sp. FJAT-49736]